MIVRELFNVEKSYVESLQILVTKYYRPLKAAASSAATPSPASVAAASGGVAIMTEKAGQIVSQVLVDDIFFQVKAV